MSVLRLAGPGSATTREVDVYRPAVPDSASLPVVYFLHGVPGQAGDAFGAGLATFLDNAFAHGAAPFAVAAPDGRGDHHDDTEWADAWDGSDSIETWFIDSVIPAVEGANRRDTAHRAVAGDSMGGYGAINLAERHPTLFSQVVSLAGYFHVDDPAGMFGGRSDVIAANSPDRHVDAVRGMHILLVDGVAESDRVIQGETQRFASLLGQSGIPVMVHFAPGDDNWDFASSQFGLITEFLDAGFGSA